MAIDNFRLETFNYEGSPISISGMEGEFIFKTIQASQTFYELDLLEALADRLEGQDGIIVDVGANLGNHSVFFASALGREVIAVEPDPLNLAILQENCKLNRIDELVEITPGAAWDRPGYVKLHQMIEGNRGTFSATVAESGIRAFTLDSKLGGHAVAAIKVDVEGNEVRVLKGALETIKRCKPILSVEIHDAGRRREIASLLEPLGYVLGSIKGASDNYVWVDNPNIPLSAHAERERIEVMRRVERNDAATASAVREIGRTVRSIPSEESTGSFRAQTLEALSEIKKHGISLDELSHKLSAHQDHQRELFARLERIQEYLDRAESTQDSNHSPIAEVNSSFLDLGARLERLQSSIDRLEIAERATSTFTSDLLTKSKDSSNRLEEVESAVKSLAADQPASMADISAELDRLSTQLPKDLAEELQPFFTTMLELRDAVDQADEKTKAPLDILKGSMLTVEELLRDSVQSLDAKIKHLAHEIKRVREETEKYSPSLHSTESFGTTEAHSAQERFERLFRSYARMAGRLEALAPQRWNAAELVAAAAKGLNVDPIDSEDIPSAPPEEEPDSAQTLVVSEVPAYPPRIPGTRYRDPVRIGIASMPGREFGLKTVLEILHTQADEIFVYLNAMSSVPAILPAYPNVHYFLGPDIGDRGKFKFIQGFHGYYLTCDDDIEYAPFHVQSIIDGIERYDRKAVVGWHGSIFKEDFQEFYNPKYRQVLSFRFLRGVDTPVHLLGTGVCGFHTESLKVSYDDFIYPNMADAFLAIAAKEQGVGMIVLAHGKDWAKPIDVGPSISTVSLKRDKSEKKDLDTASTVTRLIKDNGPWKATSLTPSYSRRKFSVAFVGRTDKDRWKKGGILKSAHLTADLLHRFGVETLLEDIETGDPKGLSGRDAEIVLVYVGDPERPDFKNVEEIVRHHAQAGRRVIVNLSYNGKDSRTKFIVDKIREWRKGFGSRVWLMVFTEALQTHPLLSAVRDCTVTIPKTISLPDAPAANFAHSSGIFLGDIAKMSDNYLLDYPAQEWISSIRRALPEVPLYAVRQYKPKYAIDLDIDEVWPFLDRENFARNISKARLMLSMVKYATFEMVPVEVASLGIPVIYPEMPQSLDEHIGLSGMSVRTPAELESILPVLYYDPIVWRSFSEASIKRAHSAELNNLAGQMYLRLLAILEKD